MKLHIIYSKNLFSEARESTHNIGKEMCHREINVLYFHLNCRGNSVLRKDVVEISISYDKMNNG